MSTPQLPNNSIQFPGPRIDFENDVGTLNQPIDNYPAPNTQLRYDWARMVYLGLLAQQSSFDPPTNYRTGTPFFDMNTMSLKISINDTWVPYSEVINMGTDIAPYMLNDWFTHVSEAISGFGSDIVFSGVSDANGVVNINIPNQLVTTINQATIPYRCFLYINGLLSKLSSTSLIGSPISSIALSNGLQLNNGDEFTVTLRAIPDSAFYQTVVHVP